MLETHKGYPYPEYSVYQAHEFAADCNLLYFVASLYFINEKKLLLARVGLLTISFNMTSQLCMMCF